jgi:hypothetical protein
LDEITFDVSDGHFRDVPLTDHDAAMTRGMPTFDANVPFLLSPNGDCDATLPSFKLSSIEFHQAVMGVE